MGANAATLKAEIAVSDKGTVTVKKFAKGASDEFGKVGKTVTTKMSGAIKKFGSLTMKSFRTITKSIFSMKTAFIGLAVYGINRAISAWEQLSGVQEKAEAGMTQAMKSMGRYTQEYRQDILDTAAALQKMSTFGDEAILQGAKFLMTYKGISDDVMPRVMGTMTDLAALMKGDFMSAANMLGKASMGMTGELRRVGITVDQDVWKARGFIGVLEQIEEQVRGQAKALRDTKAGGLEAFGNVVGDVKEKFGLFTSTIKSYIVDQIMPTVEALNEKFGEWVSSGAMEAKAREIGETMVGWIKTIMVKAESAKGAMQAWLQNMKASIEETSVKVQALAHKYLPMIRTEVNSLKGVWDSVPDWMKGAGVMGAVLFGRKGSAALLSTLHLIDTAKNTARGFVETGKGNIGFGELAGMNFSELRARLREIDADRDAATYSANLETLQNWPVVNNESTTTNININQQVSRSDVSNIISESQRQSDRA